MRKNKSSAFAAVGILIAAGMFGLSLNAKAAWHEAPCLELPVRLEAEGFSGEEEFSFLLKTDQPDGPMPEGSVNGEYILTFSEPGMQKFPAIRFDQPGAYTYAVRQIPAFNASAACDPTVYTMTVYAANREDGSGLEVTAALRQEGKLKKQEAACFANQAAQAPSAPQTPAASLSGKNETVQTAAEYKTGICALAMAAAAAGLEVLGRKARQIQSEGHR